MNVQRDPADGDRFFDEKLEGLDASECPIPYCRARGYMKTTGWVEYAGSGTGLAGWWLEAECPDHGAGRVSISRLSAQVAAALSASGRGGKVV